MAEENLPPAFLEAFQPYLTEVLESGLTDELDLYEFSANYFESKVKKQESAIEEYKKDKFSPTQGSRWADQSQPDFSYESSIALHPHDLPRELEIRDNLKEDTIYSDSDKLTNEKICVPPQKEPLHKELLQMKQLFQERPDILQCPEKLQQIDEFAQLLPDYIFVMAELMDSLGIGKEARSEKQAMDNEFDSLYGTEEKISKKEYSAKIPISKSEECQTSLDWEDHICLFCKMKQDESSKSESPPTTPFPKEVIQLMNEPEIHIPQTLIPDPGQNTIIDTVTAQPNPMRHLLNPEKFLCPMRKTENSENLQQCQSENKAQEQVGIILQDAPCPSKNQPNIIQPTCTLYSPSLLCPNAEITNNEKPQLEGQAHIILDMPNPSKEQSNIIQPTYTLNFPPDSQIAKNKIKAKPQLEDDIILENMSGILKNELNIIQPAITLYFPPDCPSAKTTANETTRLKEKKDQSILEDIPATTKDQPDIIQKTCTLYFPLDSPIANTAITKIPLLEDAKNHITSEGIPGPLKDQPNIIQPACTSDFTSKTVANPMAKTAIRKKPQLEIENLISTNMSFPLTDRSDVMQLTSLPCVSNERLDEDKLDKLILVIPPQEEKEPQSDLATTEDQLQSGLQVSPEHKQETEIKRTFFVKPEPMVPQIKRQVIFIFPPAETKFKATEKLKENLQRLSEERNAEYNNILSKGNGNSTHPVFECGNCLPINGRNWFRTYFFLQTIKNIRQDDWRTLYVREKDDDLGTPIWMRQYPILGEEKSLFSYISSICKGFRTWYFVKRIHAIQEELNSKQKRLSDVY